MVGVVLVDWKFDMNEKEGFLKAIAENDDDATLHLVYSDWLEEHDEPEEAERQRKYPAAKEWLVEFCEENNPGPPDPDGYVSDDWVITPDMLLDFGRRASEEARDNTAADFLGASWPVRGHWSFATGNNQTMCDALRDNKMEFWKNWSILTGIPLPADLEEKCWFSCAC